MAAPVAPVAGIPGAVDVAAPAGFGVDVGVGDAAANLAPDAALGAAEVGLDAPVDASAALDVADMPKTKGGGGAVIVVVVLLLLGLGGGGVWYFFLRGRGGDSGTSSKSSKTASAKAAGDMAAAGMAAAGMTGGDAMGTDMAAGAMGADMAADAMGADMAADAMGATPDAGVAAKTPDAGVAAKTPDAAVAAMTPDAAAPAAAMAPMRVWRPKRKKTKKQLRKEYVKKARQMISGGQYAASRRHLTAALRIHDGAYIRMLFAQTYAKAGNTWSAIHHQKKAVSMSGSAYYRLVLARYYLKVGKRGQACTQIRAARKRSPKNKSAINASKRSCGGK